jgi:glutamine synthetase
MQALGKEVAEKYAELKMQEWQEYQRNLPTEEDHVGQWEIQKYLYD